MRAAPNPNGPWHVGHARMPAVIGTYKERYDGKFICRFDDTDPETKRDMDAYDAILEDIAYLGFEADRVLKASDRLETYYDHARDLIDAGGAYTCSCSGDDFSALKKRRRGVPPPRQGHRDGSRGVLGDGRRRVFRRRDGPPRADRHRAQESRAPRLGCVPDDRHAAPARGSGRLPLLAHARLPVRRRRPPLTGVTHIIRGIDLQDSAKRQRFVYDYFDWEYPRCSTGATCRSTSTT